MQLRAWPGLIILVAATVSSAPTPARAGVAPLWQELAGAFGDQPCGGGGCYTNYMRIADLDGDGDLDVVFPNDSGVAEPLVIYANDGAAGFTDVSATAVGDHTGRIRQVAIGDIDGDGDLDIYAPEVTSTLGAMFVNDGDGVFVDEGDVRLPATVLATGSTRFGDLDDDGDLDLVAADHGGGGDSLVLRNDGDGYFTELADAIPYDIGSDINDVDLLDIDRDYDLDILTNAHGGTNRIWINDGTGVFGESLFASSGGLHYNPGVCDVDSDGDLDIWIDNQGPDYTERLWANDGAGNFTDVTVEQVTGNPSSDDNGIICADVDSDGDFDAVVMALGTPERLLVNDSGGNFTYQGGAFSGPTDSTLGAEMGDLDGDHRIDIATGQGESGSYLDRVFLANAAVATDDIEPRIFAIGVVPEGELMHGDKAVMHFAISDNALSDHGPRLASAYARIDPDGADEQVAAFFMGGDVFRIDLPTENVSGEVTFELCAEDPSGNVGCSDPLVYLVEGGGETTGGSSEGGSESSESSTGTSTGTAGTESDSGAVDESSGSTGVGPSTSATTVTTAADDSSEGSSSSTGVNEAGEDDGCSCSSGGSRAPLGLVLLALGLRRRRQRSAPASIHCAIAT
jgi:MYXO-CTERM domain-containing protein